MGDGNASLASPGFSNPALATCLWRIVTGVDCVLAIEPYAVGVYDEIRETRGD